MRKIIILFLFILVSCGSNKRVYWCGDHACINKKEREAYFKKHMMVEVRELNNNSKKDKSEIKKIREKAILKEKERIKKEKELAKLEKREEKERIKKEKELAKLEKREEKETIKKEKKLIKFEKNNTVESYKDIAINKDFNSLVDGITERNKLRPYPDINDIPN